MQVTVNAAANIPPTANAGPDQNITLPTNAVNLQVLVLMLTGLLHLMHGLKYPANCRYYCNTTAAATTNVTGLAQGTYLFVLKVTDNGGAAGTDTMQVTVNAAANIPPTANAGPDQNITLPTNAVNLNGSGTDTDGDYCILCMG
ncbi:MAG: hypothetical protein WDM90_18585 [Ferruginibacter sp.]